jgi:outer membrane immunogenic protein
MKKYLLASVSVVALAAASPASAVPPVPYNWTGWYVGGNIGYSWGTATSNYTEPGFACCGLGLPTSFSGSENLNGIIGGAQFGYNWQANDRWVVGFEADIQGSSEQGSRSFRNPYGSDVEGFAINQTQAAKIMWFGTVRARAGVLVNPTLWLYGTGGLAYGGISASGTVTDTGCSPVACSWSYGGSATNVGWTVGAGLEGVIPHMPHWTWKIEYLYIDFGTISGTGFDSNDFGSPYSWSARITDNIVRVGVNYQFH